MSLTLYSPSSHSRRASSLHARPLSVPHCYLSVRKSVDRSRLKSRTPLDSCSVPHACVCIRIRIRIRIVSASSSPSNIGVAKDDRDSNVLLPSHPTTTDTHTRTLACTISIHIYSLIDSIDSFTHNSLSGRSRPHARPPALSLIFTHSSAATCRVDRRDVVSFLHPHFDSHSSIYTVNLFQAPASVAVVLSPTPSDSSMGRSRMQDLC